MKSLIKAAVTLAATIFALCFAQAQTTVNAVNFTSKTPTLPTTNVILVSYRDTEWTIKGHSVSVEAEQICMTQFVGNSTKWFFPYVEHGEILEVCETDSKGEIVSQKNYSFYSIQPISLLLNGRFITVTLRKKASGDNDVEP